MFIRKVLFFLLLAVTCRATAYSQQDDFCNAVTTIVRDAPNKFRNIRGKLIDANANATLWATGITVPGTIGSRFVASMGLFYEGAFLQTKNKDELEPAYKKYKALLSACLAPLGYTLSQTDNFYPGLGSYKKIVFMLDEKDAVKPGIPQPPPAHITMEAAYNKDVDKYTIVMYIFEH